MKNSWRFMRTALMWSVLFLTYNEASHAVQNPVTSGPNNGLVKPCPGCQRPPIMQPNFKRFLDKTQPLSFSGWQQTLVSWQQGQFDFDMKTKRDLRFIFDTDIGFDPDDYLGLVTLLKHVKENYPTDYQNRVFVSTAFWHPEQKAAIAKKIMEAYGFNPDNVQPGIGIYVGEEGTFRDRYLWSALFGKADAQCPPSSMDEVIAVGQQIEAKSLLPEQEKEIRSQYKGCIYQYQTDALNKTYPNTAYPRFKNRAVRDLLGFLQNSADNSVVIVSNAAMDNIASIVQNQPHLFRQKVNRVVAMGGYFNSPNKERTGYNTGISIKAAAQVFNSGVPTLLVSSTFAATYDLSRVETESLFLPALKEIFQQSSCVGTGNEASCLGAKMISRAGYNWEYHRLLSGTSGGVLAADLINTTTAFHPEAINGAKAISFVLHPENIKDPKNFDIITTTNMPQLGIYTLNENPDPKTSTIFSLSHINVDRLNMWENALEALKKGF